MCHVSILGNPAAILYAVTIGGAEVEFEEVSMNTTHVFSELRMWTI
jgi:hypothetical protein